MTVGLIKKVNYELIKNKYTSLLIKMNTKPFSYFVSRLLVMSPCILTNLLRWYVWLQTKVMSQFLEGTALYQTVIYTS